MDEHPLIRFAEGPASRRARIVGTGMDVWEIIEAVRDNDGDVHRSADYLEMPLPLVQAAVIYYAAYSDEIDEWIDLNAREVERAHASWLAGKDTVGERDLVEDVAVDEEFTGGEALGGRSVG